MRYILLTMALMLASCSDCRSACLPVAECSLMSLSSCIRTCNQAGKKAAQVGRQKEYNNWRVCLEGLDRHSERSCKSSYYNCQRAVSLELFR